MSHKYSEGEIFSELFETDKKVKHEFARILTIF